MRGLEIVVLIGALVVLGGVLAPRLRLPAPLVQLLLGVGVGFVPAVGDVQMPPEVVLFLFLPRCCTGSRSTPRCARPGRTPG